ncbi:MAG: methionyl-tRNA formyltransferase [Proteobacteria bacterium]|nr:methionyl-tRNA formyltransferase [Pseudomonadota bacterium]
MTALRLAFMGSPEFALPSLRALEAAGHEIAAVYAQPPRPAGRGHRERPCPVQAYAERRGWALRTPKTLKDGSASQAFAALGLDAAVVVAYGLILPAAVLAAPRLGCVNLHASLLPRWRGAAPIQRAILAGDAQTGVTIMAVDEGLDTGPILLREAVPIAATATAADLHDRLAEVGARLMVAALDGLAAGRLEARPQPEDGVTYAAKLKRGEGRLDWRRPAAELERAVRAFTPWPGAFFEAGGERVKVLAAEVVAGAPGAEPGTVIDARLTVACAKDALRLIRVQRAGKAAMDAETLLRGFPVAAGTRLPLPGAGP